MFLQRNARKKGKPVERKVSESKIEELRKKNAAKKIQKEWRHTQDVRKEVSMFLGSRFLPEFHLLRYDKSKSKEMHRIETRNYRE